MRTPRRASGKTTAPQTPADPVDKPAKNPVKNAGEKAGKKAGESAVEKTAKKLAKKVAGNVAKAASLISGIVGKKSAAKQPAAKSAAAEPPKAPKAKKGDAASPAKKPDKTSKPRTPAGERAASPAAETTKVSGTKTGKPAKTPVAKAPKTAKTVSAENAPKVTKPVKPSRPTSFSAREVERPYGFPPDTPELPSSYGEDRFVLMTKDPDTLFAYWEITPARTAESEKTMRRGARYQEALRLNWPARELFENNFVVFPITFTSRKWYVRVPTPGLSYHADIGWLADDGHFVPLMTSNASDAPESWEGTRRRLKTLKGFKGPGPGRALMERAARAGGPQGSSDRASPPIADDEGYDGNFQGPASQTSSGTSGASAKPARRTAE